MSRYILFTTTLLAIVAMSAFAIVSAGAQRIQLGLSPSFGDLNTVQSVAITDPSGQVLLQGTFSTTSDTPKEAERTAELASPAGGAATGKAEIEIARNNGSATKDEIELTAERLPAATNCKLVVDGKEAANFTTNSKGKVDLKLSRKLPATR
jgi:hypothetical protein